MFAAAASAFNASFVGGDGGGFGDGGGGGGGTALVGSISESREPSSFDSRFLPFGVTVELLAGGVELLAGGVVALTTGVCGGIDDADGVKSALIGSPAGPILTISPVFARRTMTISLSSSSSSTYASVSIKLFSCQLAMR